MKNLLHISPDDWAKAGLFFMANRQAQVMPIGTSGVKQDFVKFGTKVVALTPLTKIITRTDSEPGKLILGQGSFGTAEVAQDNDGEDYAVKIEPRAAKPSDTEENEILQRMGLFFGMVEYQLETPQRTQYNNHEITTHRRVLRLMKLFSGQDLNQIFESKTLSMPAIIHLCIKVLMKLRYMHEKGIIHGDIKPSNIKALIEQGICTNLEFMDFGFSRLITPEKPFKIMSVKGTPHYTAPEIIKQHVFSIFSDLYALGMMFKDLGLPKPIWEDMVSEYPIKRPHYNVTILKLLALLKTQPECEPNLINALRRDIVQYIQITHSLAKKPDSTPISPTIKKMN